MSKYMSKYYNENVIDELIRELKFLKDTIDFNATIYGDHFEIPDNYEYMMDDLYFKPFKHLIEAHNSCVDLRHIICDNSPTLEKKVLREMHTDIFGCLDKNTYQEHFTKKEDLIQGKKVIMYRISSQQLDSIELYYYQDPERNYNETQYKIHEINSGSVSKGGPDQYPPLSTLSISEADMLEICKIVLSNSRNKLQDKIINIFNASVV